MRMQDGEDGQHCLGAGGRQMTLETGSSADDSECRRKARVQLTSILRYAVPRREKP